jgi:hypothetical protein
MGLVKWRVTYFYSTFFTPPRGLRVKVLRRGSGTRRNEESDKSYAGMVRMS